MGPPSEELRYFALFDILGFSNAIKNSLDDVVRFLGSADWKNELLSFRDGLQSTWNNDQPEDRRSGLLRFSDTILIYQDSNSEPEDLADLLVTSMGVFTTCQSYGFPLRGVLTHGQLYISPDEDIYVGEGLVRAHRLEKNQNWSGAFIETDRMPNGHHETLARLQSGGTIIPYEVPMKEGLTKKRDTLAWPSIQATTKKSLRSKLVRHTDPEELDERDNQKIENTLDFWMEYKRRYGTSVSALTDSGELGRTFEVADDLEG